MLLDVYRVEHDQGVVMQIIGRKLLCVMELKVSSYENRLHLFVGDLQILLFLGPISEGW